MTYRQHAESHQVSRLLTEREHLLAKIEKLQADLAACKEDADCYRTAIDALGEK